MLGIALPALGTLLPVFVTCEHELVTAQPCRETQRRTAFCECGQGSVGRQERTQFAGAGGQWKVSAKGRALLPVSGVRTPAESFKRARAVTRAVRRGPVARFARSTAYLLYGEWRRRCSLGQADAERVPLGQDIEPDEPARREPHRAENGQHDPGHRSADRTFGHDRIITLGAELTVARMASGLAVVSDAPSAPEGRAFPIIGDLHSSPTLDRAAGLSVCRASFLPTQSS